MKLTNIDLKVIEYISRFDSVDGNKILSKFPDEIYETEFRLKALSGILRENPENCVPSLLEDRINYNNIGTSRSVECFRITDAGRAVLAAHITKHEEKKPRFLDKVVGTVSRYLPIPLSLVSLCAAFAMI